MVVFSCCMSAECYLSFFGKGWKSVYRNYIILSLTLRVVRLLLTTKNHFERMVCFIISVFLAYALNGWIAFLKLHLEMHHSGFRNQIQNWVLVPASMQLHMLCSFQYTFQHLYIYAYFSKKRSTEMLFLLLFLLFFLFFF